MSGGTPVSGGLMRQRHSQGYASSGDDLEDDACSRGPPNPPPPRPRSWIEDQEQKERGGVMPTLFEIQKRTHMRKDGTFVDERSQRVSEEVERRLAEASTEGDTFSVDQNKIYLEVVGGFKKQRVYGIGALGSAIVRDNAIGTSRSSSLDDIITQKMEAERVVINHKHEELTQKLEEKLVSKDKRLQELKEDKVKMKEQLDREIANRHEMKNVMESEGQQLKFLMDLMARQGFCASNP